MGLPKLTCLIFFQTLCVRNIEKYPNLELTSMTKSFHNLT